MPNNISETNLQNIFIYTLFFFTFVLKLLVLIQRIQSLYLAIVGIIGGMTAFLTDLIPNSLLDMFSFILIAILAFISIFTYNKRKIQIRINYLNIIINLVLIGLMVYFLLNTSGEMQISEKGVGVIISVLFIILLFIANKYIKKDENLIKSVDRFR